MSLYSDPQYPVRDDLAAIHASQLDQLAEPGSWGTGAQRLAIAAETRRAGCDAGRCRRSTSGFSEPPGMPGSSVRVDATPT